MERLRNLLKVEFARSASDSQVEVKQSHPQLRSQVSCPPTTGMLTYDTFDLGKYSIIRSTLALQEVPELSPSTN